MKYATANSRKAVKWTNGDTTMEALKARFQSTVRTTETIEEYRKMSKGRHQGRRRLCRRTSAERATQEGLCALPLHADAGH